MALQQSESDVYARLTETLLDQLANGQATDEALLGLNHVMGTGLLMPALTLVDKGDVVKISMPNGRYLYQVAGSTGKPYTVHPTCLYNSRPYCPCISFGTSCLISRQQYMCKHLLAVAIAQRTGGCRETQVEREGVAALLGLA